MSKPKISHDYIEGTCAVCGRPGHRYGTTDPEHDHNPTACINGLRHENDELKKALRNIRTTTLMTLGMFCGEPEE